MNKEAKELASLFALLATTFQPPSYSIVATVYEMGKNVDREQERRCFSICGFF